MPMSMAIQYRSQIQRGVLDPLARQSPWHSTLANRFLYNTEA
jgi:hypothetical protein